MSETEGGFTGRTGDDDIAGIVKSVARDEVFQEKRGADDRPQQALHIIKLGAIAGLAATRIFAVESVLIDTGSCRARCRLTCPFSLEIGRWWIKAKPLPAFNSGWAEATILPNPKTACGRSLEGETFQIPNEPRLAGNAIGNCIGRQC